MWGALLGAAVGLFSANSASNSASDASAAASNASAASLAFDKQRYADWQGVYGDIQKNLSDYYMSRTPTAITAQGIQSYEKEKVNTLNKIRDNFASRGISSDSGLAVQANTDVQMQSLASRAQIRANAPIQAANEKLSFLEAGLGSNPGNTVSSDLSNNARSLTSAATNATTAKWDSIGNATDSVTNLIETLGK